MINRLHFSPLSELSFIQTRPAGSRLTLALLLISGLTVWACGGEDTVGPGTGNGTATVASVVVTPGNTTLVSLGETVQLTASARDANGNPVSGKSFTWASSDATVVTVSSTGSATAVADGSATITATTDGVDGTAAIAVDQMAAQLAFTVQPTETQAGASMTPAVGVTIQDAAGNPIADATDAVTVTIGDNPSGGTLTGATVVDAVAGVASFGDLVIDLAGADYTFQATSGTLTSVTSTTFDVTNPVPGITALSPSRVTAGGIGGADLTLTVDGSNFVPGSVVLFDGVGRASTLISDTQLEALLPTSDIADGGTAAITVFNPEPGGGTSNELSLAIDNPVPNITSISPSAAAVGASDFNLVVNGSAFVPSSVVRWDGADLPTTFEQSNRLTAMVSGAELGSLGAAAVTVFNPQPSGGVSEDIAFTIYQSVTIATNDIIYNPVDGMIYASTPSTAGGIGNTISSIDPNSGDIGFSVFVGSEPNPLAVSSDGGTLYVGLDGSAQVRRFDIASQTAGLQFGLGSDAFFGGFYAEDIEVLPGASQSIAVSRKNLGISPRHAGVAIYDDGAVRPTATARHTGSNRIELSGSPTTLYGFNNETTEFGFRTMDIDASGITVTDVTQGLISGFAHDIVFEGGRIYATSGAVINPETLTLLGTNAASGPVRPDASIGRVFYLSEGTSFSVEILVFDDTFVPIGSLELNGISGNATSLIRLGPDELGFRTDSNQVIVVQHPLLGGN